MYHKFLFLVIIFSTLVFSGSKTPLGRGSVSGEIYYYSNITLQNVVVRINKKDQKMLHIDDPSFYLPDLVEGKVKLQFPLFSHEVLI